MAADPRIPNQNNQQSPKVNLESFARSKIGEVIKRKILDRTKYQEPDDTCDCGDFVTSPPNPPTIPNRRRPPKLPIPPKPPIIAPPLPPPPVRFTAPQLPNVIPPLIAPPAITFPPPVPDIEVQIDGGGTGATAASTTPGTSTTESPSGDTPDDFWEGSVPCCGTPPIETPFATDIQLSLAVEESSHSGEFRNGCYPMCNAGSLAIYRLGWENAPLDPYNNRPPAGFCDRNQIQICQCMARNNPSNPCYKGNGQVSKPGANITSTSGLKRIPLPRLYNTPAEYYAANLNST